MPNIQYNSFKVYYLTLLYICNLDVYHDFIKEKFNRKSIKYDTNASLYEYSMKSASFIYKTAKMTLVAFNDPLNTESYHRDIAIIRLWDSTDKILKESHW